MGRNNKIVPRSMCNWLLLLVVIMQFVVSLCIRNVWSIFSSNDLASHNYILVMQIFAVGLPSVLLCLFNGSGFSKTFGIKKIGLSDAGKCALLGFCLQPVGIAANIIWQRIFDVSYGRFGEISAADFKTVAAAFVFTCIVPAVCEEFLLRGMYLNSVKRKGYAFAVITSTFMFVLLHMEPANIPSQALLGAIAAVTVFYTGSVFGGVMVHMGFNTGGLVLDLIAYTYYSKTGFLGSTSFYNILALAGVFLAFLLFKNIFRKKKRKTASENIAGNLFKAFFNIPILAVIAVYVLIIIV